MYNDEFNISQNDQGQQEINLGEINVQEKPQSSGVINMPPDQNLNKNIEIAPTEPSVERSSTLDEPIITTLKRDLNAIFNKIKYVVVPKLTEKKLEELYNWDLWGPLLFCFLYSIALSTGENNNNESSIFVLIFTIFWIGGFVITFNEKFLGAQIGLCQMVSLLGYGMFPITVGGIIIGFCGIRNIWVKLIIVAISLIWSCFASVGFLGSLVLPERRFIAVFPAILFLFSLSMFALNY